MCNDKNFNDDRSAVNQIKVCELIKVDRYKFGAALKLGKQKSSTVLFNFQPFLCL